MRGQGSLSEQLKAATEQAERTTALLALANEDLQQEIARRTAAEARVRENEELLRAFFNAIPARVVLKDSDLRFITANSAACDGVGRSLAEIVERKEAETADVRVAYPREQRDQEVLAQQIVVQDIEDVVESDGKLRVFETTRFPFHSPQGDLQGVGIIAFDVTARHEAEAALHHVQSRAQAIFETAADGIVITDEQGLIEALNPAVMRMFGLSEKPSSISTLVPEAISRLVQATSRGTDGIMLGQSWDIEGIRDDGESFPLEVMVSEVESGRRLYTWMIRDVTERKRIEQMKRDFVSTVSHELRTPMSAIVGALGLIQSGAVGVLPDKAASLVGIAHKNCSRLVRLLNDILDIESISSGKVRMTLQPLELDAVVRDAIALAQPQAEQLGVTFDFVADAGGIVMGDADRLVQVISNLISNAVKYSPASGTVQIRLLSLEDQIFVSVADQGPGVPASFQSQIFSRFARADTRDSRDKGGTGLGLAICKLIVEMHGGAIGFSSEEGQGATFFFKLPRYLLQSKEQAA